MMDTNKIICCDKCAKEFVCQSVQIKQTSVDIEGNVLLLRYFACPFCNTVYKVLLVEEEKYQDLVDDLVSVLDRIERQRGKGNLMLAQKLQNMALKKHKRIRNYIDGISKKYPGSFVLVTKNDQAEECIEYLP